MESKLLLKLKEIVGKIMWVHNSPGTVLKKPDTEEVHSPLQSSPHSTVSSTYPSFDRPVCILCRAGLSNHRYPVFLGESHDHNIRQEDPTHSKDKR